MTEVQDALDRELISNRQLPTVLRTHDLPLPVSRNYLVETALKVDEWKHALLLDDDVILPKGAIKQMLKLKADVAVMDYPMKGKQSGKWTGTIVRDKDKSIAYAGLGAVLVKREVFEKIPSPWFVLSQYKVNRGKKGEILFNVGQPDGIDMVYSAGEDTYFFLQCRKHDVVVKETVKTATHCSLDQVINNMHRIRYSRQHIINKYDKIEHESI